MLKHRTWPEGQKAAPGEGRLGTLDTSAPWHRRFRHFSHRTLLLDPPPPPPPPAISVFSPTLVRSHPSPPSPPVNKHLSAVCLPPPCLVDPSPSGIQGRDRFDPLDVRHAPGCILRRCRPLVPDSLGCLPLPGPLSRVDPESLPQNRALDDRRCLRSQRVGSRSPLGRGEHWKVLGSCGCVRSSSRHLWISYRGNVADCPSRDERKCTKA